MRPSANDAGHRRNPRKKDAAPGRGGDLPTSGLTLRHTLRGHEGKIIRAAWSPDGRLIASCDLNGRVYTWDPAENKAVSMFQFDGEVDAIAWSPDSERLAVGTTGGTLYIWASLPNQVLHTFQAGSEEVLSLAWSGGGGALVSSVLGPSLVAR